MPRADSAPPQGAASSGGGTWFEDLPATEDAARLRNSVHGFGSILAASGSHREVEEEMRTTGLAEADLAVPLVAPRLSRNSIRGSTVHTCTGTGSRVL